MLFLDLAKAFDTVDFDIMIEKLRSLGFKSNVRNWFRSYLSDRTQVTVVSGQESSPGQMSSGVPQGSILGPLLFICYINDLPDVLRHSTPFLYADDTALLTKGSNVTDLEFKLNNDANNVSDWFSRNRLSCNVKKTKVMKFCNSRSGIRHEPVAVSMNNQPVEEVNQFKYLGLHLDSHLNFEVHANKIAGKVRSCTAAMWRCRQFIPLELAKSLYTSLIEPHFIYGCVHYDACSVKAANTLQAAQNKALRSVLSVNHMYSSSKLHAKLQIPTLKDSRLYHTVCFAYKGINNLSTNMINELFISGNRGMGLRSEQTPSMMVPVCRTVLGSRCLLQRCNGYWMALPTETRLSPSSAVFKRNARAHICQYSYSQ